MKILRAGSSPAPVSGSSARKGVGVRVPPSAPGTSETGAPVRPLRALVVALKPHLFLLGDLPRERGLIEPDPPVADEHALTTTVIEDRGRGRIGDTQDTGARRHREGELAVRLDRDGAPRAGDTEVRAVSPIGIDDELRGRPHVTAVDQGSDPLAAQRLHVRDGDDDAGRRWRL